jgi:hypothetical protein
MSTTRTGHDFDTQALATPGARTILRAKTVATRLSTEELEEVESAAKRSGKSLAEWLRDTALVESRQRPADPVEVVLAEVCATHYMLLNLFHATAQAASEGKQLLPETVLRIRETADAQKATKARKLLQDSAVSGRPEPKNESKHEPPDAISQTLSVADNRHRDAHRASGFAGGGMVLVGDAAAPELLLDYLSRQHGTREPARSDDQG